MAVIGERFILKLCARSWLFSTPPGCHNQTDPLPGATRRRESVPWPDPRGSQRGWVLAELGQLRPQLVRKVIG
jgi:hypothetical protein